MPRLACLLALLALAACGPDSTDAPAPAPAAEGEALSADEVVDRMVARYESMLGGVESFTVTGAGAEARYTLSPDTTGLDRFNPPVLGAAGNEPMDRAGARLLELQIPNVPRLAAGIGAAAFDGPVVRDGRRVYVFQTDDPGALIGAPGEVPVDSSRAPDLRVYVSAETFDVVEIYQSVRPEPDAAPVESRILYSDFREADGVTLPWSVRQVETGLNAALTDEEKMVLGGRIGLRRQQTEALPPGPQREALLAEIDAEQRLIGEGIAEATLTVTDVEVDGAD